MLCVSRSLSVFAVGLLLANASLGQTSMRPPLNAAFGATNYRFIDLSPNGLWILAQVGQQIGRIQWAPPGPAFSPEFPAFQTSSHLWAPNSFSIYYLQTNAAGTSTVLTVSLGITPFAYPVPQNTQLHAVGPANDFVYGVVTTATTVNLVGISLATGALTTLFVGTTLIDEVSLDPTGSFVLFRERTFVGPVAPARFRRIPAAGGAATIISGGFVAGRERGVFVNGANSICFLDRLAGSGNRQIFRINIGNPVPIQLASGAADRSNLWVSQDQQNLIFGRLTSQTPVGLESVPAIMSPLGGGEVLLDEHEVYTFDNLSPIRLVTGTSPIGQRVAFGGRTPLTPASQIFLTELENEVRLEPTLRIGTTSTITVTNNAAIHVAFIANGRGLAARRAVAPAAKWQKKPVEANQPPECSSAAPEPPSSSPSKSESASRSSVDS